MSHVETVNQDTRSYRQGLVLGLTMAEVFLLLVFALLIALATLWNSEREKRKAAEDKLGGPPDLMKGLSGKIKGARHASVPNAAHIANIQNPEGFNRVLGEFLK